VSRVCALTTNEQRFFPVTMGDRATHCGRCDAVKDADDVFA
jgi:hypothetical protein